VEEHLKKFSEVQEELKECLQISQESLKCQFDEHQFGSSPHVVEKLIS
ncbi:adenosinetriphosphatase, partial [Puccinia sorghi]